MESPLKQLQMSPSHPAIHPHRVTFQNWHPSRACSACITQTAIYRETFYFFILYFWDSLISLPSGFVLLYGTMTAIESKHPETNATFVYIEGGKDLWGVWSKPRGANSGQWFGINSRSMARGHSELFGVGLLLQLLFHDHLFLKSRGKM